MKAPDIWSLLGIESTGDTRAIRRAYAAQLKAIDIDADPEHYAALRSAREEALRLAAEGVAPVDPRDARWHDPIAEESDVGVEDGGLRLAIHPFRLLAIDIGATPAATIAAAAVADLQRYKLETGALAPGTAADGRSCVLSFAQACAFHAPLINTVSAGTVTAFADQPHDDGEHYNGILAILFPGGERREDMPSPEQEAALIGHFNAIVHGPRIGEMAHFADAERWFGDIVAHGAPASNCLMAPAADFFRWRERAGELAEADTVAFINRRLKTFEFIEQVSREDHHWHRAWRELTTYAHERSSRGWRVKRQHVRELLEAVRRDCPDVEGYFDGTRVALWENSAGSFNIPLGYLVFPGFMLLVLLGRCSEMDAERNRRIEAPAPALNLTVPPIARGIDQRSDIDTVLQVIGFDKLTLALAESRNPELASMLKSNWALARESAGGMAEFPQRLRNALNDRTRLVMRNAPYRTIAAFKRNELERAELYRLKDLVYCDDLFTLGKRRPLPGSDAIDRRQAALVEAMLIETTDLTQSPARSYVIPGPVFQNVVDSTRLTSERVQAALDGKADATDRCDVRIALFKAALALPPDQGLPLLRVI